MTIRSLPNLDGFLTPVGAPALHDERAWYATDDNTVLGIIVRDRIDNDFGFVVLAQDTVLTEAPSGGYGCVDSAVSHPTIDAAIIALHDAMRRYHGRARPTG